LLPTLFRGRLQRPSNGLLDDSGRRPSKKPDFRIHQFTASAESLLLTFLPYHSEPLYTRILQIVSLPSNFSFLSQYTNIRISSTLPPVSRQLFVRALSRDPVFLESYFTFVINRATSGHSYSGMIVKWSTITIETILQMRQARTAEEIIVSRIMPFLAKGLQMKHNSEFQIATYTVLTILASNHSLTDEVVRATTDSICRGWTEKSRRCGILCLVTLAQNRADAIPDSVVKSVVSIDDLMTLIDSLPAKVSSGQFLVGLAKKVLGSSQILHSQPILSDITFSDKLTASDRQSIIQAAINRYSVASKKIQPELSKWISSISKDHPQEFKDSIAILIDTLPSDQIKEFEAITNLSLKVTNTLHTLINRTRSMKT
jgi:U3 small nucleolar RNA-associated protein 10